MKKVTKQRHILFDQKIDLTSMSIDCVRVIIEREKKPYIVSICGPCMQCHVIFPKTIQHDESNEENCAQHHTLFMMKLNVCLYKAKYACWLLFSSDFFFFFSSLLFFCFLHRFHHYAVFYLLLFYFFSPLFSF